MIYYIPGLRSTSSGRKSYKQKSFENLAKDLNVPFIGYDYWSYHLDDILTDVNDDIQDIGTSGPIVFVGTSMGGYLANLLGKKHHAYSVSINPSMSLPITLQKHLQHMEGGKLKTYDGSRSASFGEDCIRSFLNENVNRGGCVPNPNGSIVALAKDDEFLDWRESYTLFKFKAQVLVYETGGHQFLDKKNVDDVIEKTKYMINSPGTDRDDNL